MSDERIMTLHPECEAAVNIERWKHDRVRDELERVPGVGPQRVRTQGAGS
jgi:hypothetical protein